MFIFISLIDNFLSDFKSDSSKHIFFAIGYTKQGERQARTGGRK